MNKQSLIRHIAFRYVKSKKSVQAINIISYISVFAVTILTAAMIILLSVFNGLEAMIDDMYQGFYPQVKVSSAKGKWLDIEDAKMEALMQNADVEAYSYVAEDMVLLFTEDQQQRIATIKGVQTQWFEVNTFESLVTEGRSTLNDEHVDQHPAIVGANIAMDLGVNVRNPLSTLQVYYPKEGVEGHDLQQALSSVILQPAGVYRQSEFDSRFILTTLSTAQYLFDNGNKLSSIDIKLKPSTSEKHFIQSLAENLGPSVKVQSQFEQNKALYMVMRSEKLAMYVILTFVLIIACFTMVGVLSMIAIDKKKDMSVLRTMGISDVDVRNIFLNKGVLYAGIGGCVGMILGLLICFGQQYFGWVKFGTIGLVEQQYPVKVNVTDIAIVLLIVLIVGGLSALIPALKAQSQRIDFKEE